MDANPIINRSSQVHEPTPDTPYHAKRRDRMRTKPSQYGFFRVVKEATSKELCSKCQKDLSGQKNGFIRINGEAVCFSCLNALD